MLGLGLSVSKTAGLRSLVARLLSKLRSRATYYENGKDSKEFLEVLAGTELLDDATIVLTPTATSDARVHSVKTYTGDELVTDGSFENGLSDWDSSNNVSIVNGAARFNNIGLSGANAYLNKDSILEAGKTYKFECDVISTNGKELVLEKANPSNTSIGATTTGHKIIYFTQDTQSHLTIKRLTSETDVTIDNISVTEADADFDFDRASSATRINSDGLVQDMQSITDPELVLNGDFEELGSELVTNGDFATDSNWSVGTNITISGGKANFLNANKGERLQQNFSFTADKTYKVVITVSNYVSGQLGFYMGGGYVDTGAIDANGTYTYYHTPTNNSEAFFRAMQTSASHTFSIDNVSVQQVDPNDRWSLSSTFEIDNGKLHCVSDGSYQYAYQANVFVVGNTYKITFDVIDYTSGSIRVRPSGQSGYTAASANGTYTQYFTATDTTLAIERGSACDLYVDNVSVKDITFSTDVDLARINYDSNGDNGHILLEPTSTNLVPYSEDFSAWAKGNITFGDDVTSPDGTTNATTLNVPDSSDYFYENYTVVASTTYTFSFFVKRGTLDSSSFLLSIYDDSNNAFISEDISYTTSTEWTRVEHTFTTPSGCTDVRLYTYRNSSGSTGTFFQWGVQLEALSYATSYIPTLTGSTVTRATETLTGSGNSTLINSTEGVLYFEGAALAETYTSNSHISLSNGSTSNRLYFYYEQSGKFGFAAFVGNVLQANIKYDGIIANNSKVACKYKENDYALWVDGVEVGVDTSASVWSSGTFDRLNFDGGDSNNDFYGKVKALAVFNEALEDDELELLTGVTNYGSFNELASANGYTII